jgi:hypothetical protein
VYAIVNSAAAAVVVVVVVAVVAAAAAAVVVIVLVVVVSAAIFPFWNYSLLKHIKYVTYNSKVSHCHHIFNCLTNVSHTICTTVYVYLDIKFHIPSSNSPLLITVKLKAKENFTHDHHVVLHSTPCTLKMETAGFSKTLISTYQTTVPHPIRPK